MRYESGLEALVRLAVVGIVIRIRQDPSVEVDRGVMRIRRIRGEVAEDPGDVDDVALDELAFARARWCESPLPKFVLKKLGHLGDLPGEKSGHRIADAVAPQCPR